MQIVTTGVGMPVPNQHAIKYCGVHDVGVAVNVAWQRTQQWLMQQ
jgi:hypothetical protein